MSLLALAIVVVISCINEDLNVGFLSIAFAIVVGGIWVDLNAAKVMNAFPLGLFMILAGVTFLFGLASTNGTMEKLAAHALRACRGQPAWLPLITYLLVTILTTIGPGNIAATALIAPVAMAIAARVGLSAFLMTLLVVGAANGAAFSPFTPTGIISNGLIAKMAPQFPGLQGLDARPARLEDRTLTPSGARGSSTSAAFWSWAAGPGSNGSASWPSISMSSPPSPSLSR